MTDLDVATLGFDLEEEMREFNDERHAAIAPLFAKYQDGQHQSIHPPPASTLRLVPSSDLHVDTGSLEIDSCDDIRDFSVSQRSDRSAVNFMGYDHERRCLAFNGETRLLVEFLSFTTDVFRCGSVEAAFRAPTRVVVPAGGLAPGLSYEEFAGRVEVIEYVMWLKGSPDDEEDPDATATINVRPVVNDETLPPSVRDVSPVNANDGKTGLGDLGTLPDADPSATLGQAALSTAAPEPIAPTAQNPEPVATANPEPALPSATNLNPATPPQVTREHEIPSADAVSALVAEHARERYSLRTRAPKATVVTPVQEPINPSADEQGEKKRIRVTLVNRGTPTKKSPVKESPVKKTPVKKAPAKKAPAKKKGGSG